MFRFFLEIGTNTVLRPRPLEVVAEYDSELDNIISLLTDICEALQETNRIAFRVDGFGQAPWTVDVATDLAVFLEQLPGLVAWMADSTASTFILDFYEQGIERRLNFDDLGNLVQITCESWGTFDPRPQTEFVSGEALSSMITKLVDCFLEQANQLAPDIVAHEWFQQWRGTVV